MKRATKDLIALACLVLGVLAGVYVGVFVMFIGGIVQLINAVKETPVPALDIAFGIARIVLSGLAGWATFATGYFLSLFFGEGL